jgi:DNA-binding beta-propeller fold protein YncE
VHRVWPSPPAEPRIELKQIVRGPDDLGKPDFFEGLANFITGRKPHTFFRPQGVAVEGDIRMYVTDQKLQGVHVLNMHSSKSAFLSKVGDTLLVSPAGIAVAEGKVVFADSALARVFVIDPTGKLLKVIDKPGGFKRPTGIAFAPQSRQLYIVDTLANEVCIFDLDGNFVRAFGGPGTAPGRFNYPTYVFVDGGGKVYVTDSLNFRVQVFDLADKWLLEIGKLGDATGYMAVPKGVGADADGNIYVVDSYLTAVQVFDPKGEFLLAFGAPGADPGDFQVPAGMAFDEKGRIFVSDSMNSRIQIFQYIGMDNEPKPSKP